MLRVQAAVLHGQMKTGVTSVVPPFKFGSGKIQCPTGSDQKALQAIAVILGPIQKECKTRAAPDMSVQTCCFNVDATTSVHIC